MLRAFFLVLAASLASSCGAGARPPFVVHIVDEAGGDPIGGLASGTITIRVRQLDMPVQERTGDIRGGVLEAVEVPITSYGIVTRIQVLIEDGSSGTDEPELIGASPPFVPLGYGFVRIVVGAPGRCASLSAPSLSTPRIGPNLISLEGNLVAIGGQEGVDGPSSGQVEILSPVQLTYGVAPNVLPALERPIGPGDAVRLGTGTTARILALADVRGPVLYFLDPDRTSQRDVDLREAQADNDVHSGAGPSSAIVDLDDRGAVILGGQMADDPADGITWVDVDGRTTRSVLSTPRARPAAVRIGDHVLVAGGQVEGERLFELVSITSHETVSFGDGPPRFGAVLVRDPASDRAWLGFGEDETGALLDTAMRIDGCPTACAATDADPIARPRRGVRVVERASETLILGGADDAGPSDAVDRVRFESGAPLVEPLGNLAAARDRPGAAPIGSGVIALAGGLGVRPEPRALADLEICFPEGLEPL